MSTQPSMHLDDDSQALLFVLMAPEAAPAAERVLWDQQRHGESYAIGSEVVSTGVLSQGDVIYPSVQDGDEDENTDNEGDISSYAGSESGHTHKTESDRELATPIDDETENATHGLARLGLGNVKDASDEGFYPGDPNRAPGPSMRASLHDGESQDLLASTFVNAKDPERQLRTQGYLLRIGILDPVPDNRPDPEVSFDVVADTGSDYLWVYGANYMELVREHPRPWAAPDFRARRRHSVLPNTGFDGTNSLKRDWDPSKYGEVIYYNYMDGSAALTGALYPLGVDVKLHGYNFTNKRKVVIELSETRLGVAYAVDKELAMEPASGILGLGANQYMLTQRYFQAQSKLNIGPSAFPSFLAVLQGSNELNPTNASSSDRFIMFITLRLPAEHYRRLLGVSNNVPVQSWIAFNRWPLNVKPTWSRRIALVPPQPGRAAQWVVKLTRFTVQRCTTAQRPDPHAKTYGTWDITWKDGYHVLLDTGCSTSRIDESVLEYIQGVVFNQKTPVRKDAEHQRFSYDVPSGFDYDMFQVRLAFAGVREGSEIAVCLPFHPFIVTHNVQIQTSNPPPMEGVLFRSNRTGRGTFGANFFQSAFVSFHHNMDEVKSVRIAPQIFQDFQTYEADLAAFDDDE